MNRHQEPRDLEQLLDRLNDATQEDGRVSMGALLEAVGRRSFGPLLLVAGLVTLSPLGDIPGTPTLMAIVVLLTSGQLLFHRRHFWLPRWLLARSVAADKLCKSLDWLRKPARFVDRWLRPRLELLSHQTYVIALVCALIAVAMPAMELVPFSATGAGLALTAFGLALMAEDGLLALLAFIFTTVTFGVVVYSLL